jgi:hypothetical protein
MKPLICPPSSSKIDINIAGGLGFPHVPVGVGKKEHFMAASLFLRIHYYWASCFVLSIILLWAVKILISCITLTEEAFSRMLTISMKPLHFLSLHSDYSFAITRFDSNY